MMVEGSISHDPYYKLVHGFSRKRNLGVVELRRKTAIWQREDVMRPRDMSSSPRLTYWK
jgi:hypothetical protein